jgi:ABC-type branched-subunit amino acid transport system substrate-binding protein
MTSSSHLRAAAALLLGLAVALGAHAQSVKIGIAHDLSGPLAVPGNEVRTG